VAGFLSGKLPDVSDRRFSSSAAGQSDVLPYLLNAEFLMAMADAVEARPRQAEDPLRGAADRRRLSPANFLATNPEAQQKLIETKGESLTKGLQNMLADMQKGRISQSDESAFEVGRNVGVTPGTVVFENELFQLIQYTPTTPAVHEVPLLMVPPCINKFYILDLQPENSLVRYAGGAGQYRVHGVLAQSGPIAWPTLTWDDYVEKGAIEAIDVARDISGKDK
jgi:polyhydroxyalkanoate synthase